LPEDRHAARRLPGCVSAELQKDSMFIYFFFDEPRMTIQIIMPMTMMHAMTIRIIGRTFVVFTGAGVVVMVVF